MKQTIPSPNTIMQGDCIEIMGGMPARSVDFILTEAQMRAFWQIDRQPHDRLGRHADFRVCGFLSVRGRRFLAFQLSVFTHSRARPSGRHCGRKGIRPSGKWQATVRRDGRSRSRTFTMRADAVRWAREAELQAEHGRADTRTCAGPQCGS